MTDRERLLDERRPVAFAIAYRMLGSVAEAEDVVQEALLRIHQALDGGERIASPRAFVATVTTRLAINELRSARARRERYVGEWVPEPIVTEGRDDPAGHAETADSLSLAMLVLAESLWSRAAAARRVRRRAFGDRRDGRQERSQRASTRQPRPVEVNGDPGALFLDGQQRLIGVCALDIADGQVMSVSSIVNPDKLTHLGPVADFGSLLKSAR
jgi:RNA polymerase sigma factor (sigma-70 family)